MEHVLNPLSHDVEFHQRVHLDLQIVDRVGSSPSRIILGFMPATASNNVSTTIAMDAVGISVTDHVGQKTTSRTMIRNFGVALLQAIVQLRQSGFEDCQKLARTLQSWQEEIARMWRFSGSNGTPEGYHRKMRLIQRRAFGFRNFENDRKRVRALCA